VSGIKSGTWHPAAYQLAKLMLIELDFYKRLFFVPSNKTSLATSIYHDYRVVEIEETMEWKLKARWKVQLAVTNCRRSRRND
jgi:hypothetical protein